VAIGAAFRLVSIGAHLPQLIGPDEPTVVDRAIKMMHGTTNPGIFGWPTGSMLFLAGFVKVASWFDGSVATATASLYRFSRIVFALVGVTVIALTGALGARVAPDKDRRALAATLAALIMALAYVSVRTSRAVGPDHLQVAFALASLLCALAYDEGRKPMWSLAGAGAFAGLAAGTKYLGGLIVIPIVVAVLWRPWDRRRVSRQLGLVVLTGAAGFILAVPAVFTAPGAVRSGIGDQLGAQASGHLGYDGLSNGWWYHLSQSLPGSWGWVVTVLVIVGVVVAIGWGTRAERLTLAFALPTALVLGASKVRFPHYMLLTMPFFAVLACSALTRLTSRAVKPIAIAAVVVVVLSLVPSAVNDLRLVRAARGTDTRELAAAEVARLRGPVRAEQYATPSGSYNFGETPSIVDCKCYAVISSYMEDRYRREPKRYARQVAVYDALRQRGKVVDVIGPRRHLAYDWDVLPQYGLSSLPALRSMGATGPTITVLDVR
jgi:hypothetical protein